MEYKGKYKDLIIPTLNVNDTKVTIADIQKKQLEYIKEGEVLYCTETSKATEDYIADFSGYVVLFVKDMDEVEIGKSAGMIFELKEDAEACLAEFKNNKEKQNKNSNINASKKAIAYADKIGFDLTLIKKTGIIKTEDIDNYLNKGNRLSEETKREISSETSLYKSNDVVLVGGGGLCLLIVDAINLSREYNIVGIVDDYATKGEMRYGYEVLGPIEATLKNLYNKGLRLAVNCVAAMESSIDSPLFFARRDVAAKIKSLGYLLPNIIHPNAKLETSCRLGEGNVILSGANIGSCAIIGDNCYINTNTMISHECIIGNGVKIAPGAILAGRIKVGDNTLIGMGTTVYMNLKIGGNVVIYNGISVFTDISDNKVVSK